MVFGVERSDGANSTENSLTLGEDEPDFHKGLDEKASLSDLPDELIEHIYTFLSRRDRCKMSMLCRRWSELCCEPRLWGTIKLNLPGNHYNMLNVHPEIALVVKHAAVKHGAEISHVEINFTDLTDIVKRQMKTFLKNLSSHSQLDSFVFRRCGFCFSRDFLDIFGAMNDFLKSQYKLTSVEFPKCNFGKSANAEILRVICEGNRNTLRKLDLTGFSLDICTSDFRFFYEAFLNIKTLVIDYSMTYESIMIAFGEFLKNNTRNRAIQNILLENIRISCISEYGLNGIPSKVWLLVKNACPNLFVDISFTPDLDFDSNSFSYIAKHIPLRSLEVLAVNIGIFSYSCWVRYWVIEFVRVFERFTKVFNKLKRVKLTLRHPVSNLCDLLESWAQRKPQALEAANITVTSVLSATERKGYMKHAKYYGSVLQMVGLSLDLITDNLV